MKLAVIAPIGPLDRYGYQHNSLSSIEGMAALGDRVYLVQSTRNDAGIRSLLEAFKNAVCISDERTWFGRVSGVEVFDIWRVVGNINIGIQQSRADGMDAAICLDLGGYVETTAIAPIRRACARMLDAGESFGWICRRDQLADKLFGVNGRAPHLYNLSAAVRAITDGIVVDGRALFVERGDYTNEDKATTDAQYVDIGLECTVDDLEAKMNFLHCYSDLLPKRSPVFDWSYWRNYHTHKTRQKPLSDEKPGKRGQAVATNTRNDFVSHVILRELGIR